MKHAKRPTREQKRRLEKLKLNPADWLVERDTPEELVLVHRFSDKTIRTVCKEN